MKPHRALTATILAALTMMSKPTLAYIGPGAGLGMIGSLLAVIVAVIVAVVGIIVYPLRLLRKKREQGKQRGDQSVG